MRREVVIVYAKRTPIGKMCGSLSQIAAPKLGAALVANALKETALSSDEVDEIILGNILQCAVGQAPARQAAIYGGLSDSVRATTVNRVCGSGLKAVVMGVQSILLEEAKVVFAGGMENMSLAPHFMRSSRAGAKFGTAEMEDHILADGLTDPFSGNVMGKIAENCASEFGFTREMQDEYAIQSYEKASQAIKSGRFKGEIAGVEVSVKKEKKLIDTDEGPSAFDAAKIRSLKPAFCEGGTITAGNASSLADGAAMFVLMDGDEARRRGIKPVARILGYASHAQKPSWFTTAPAPCIRKLFNKTGLKAEDVDLFEINEAFSCVTMAAMKELSLPAAKVNIHGGAVALGHPLGATGARIVVTLVNALSHSGKSRGVASLCIGGGEAEAIMIEMIK